jgi:hypothetical protein
MNTELVHTPFTTTNQAVVASYRDHSDAEDAVRLLARCGLPVNTISIIGRRFETHEDIQGFYTPTDAAYAGAGEGAWYGGIFGLFMGAAGYFVFPSIGALMVLGPLAGFIAGSIAGAGIGALVSGFAAAGIPKDHALKYQEIVQAGEHLVVVHGSEARCAKAHQVLLNTTSLQLHSHYGGTDGRRAYDFARRY